MEKEVRFYYDEMLGDFVNVGFRLCEGDEDPELRRCLLIRREYDVLVLAYEGHHCHFGVRSIEEFAESMPAVYRRMSATVPHLPADSARWVGEMEEIARTFASVGVTPHFHEGARDIFALLAATPLAAETRETRDASRTLEQALKVYRDHLPDRQGDA